MNAIIKFFKSLFHTPAGQLPEFPYKVEAPAVEKPKRVRKPRVAIKEPAKKKAK